MDQKTTPLTHNVGWEKTQQVRLRELLFRGNLDTDLSQLQKIFHVLGACVDGGVDVCVCGGGTCGCDKGRGSTGWLCDGLDARSGALALLLQLLQLPVPSSLTITPPPHTLNPNHR